MSDGRGINGKKKRGRERERELKEFVCGGTMVGWKEG